jgi:uncharacterized membrane protein YecN with MAPEG domain
MTRRSPTQVAVGRGVIAAWAWTLALFALALWPGRAIAPAVTEPLTLLAAWLALPAAVMVVMIARIARRRYHDPALIDGQDAPPGSGFDADQRVLRNTTEQLVLAAVVWAALAVQIRPDHLTLIPALAIGFTMARIAFWWGYPRGAGARAFGFAATFYPTLLALFWALWLLLVPA